MTVARARQLHATGRPHEALRVLDGIDLADPARPVRRRASRALAARTPCLRRCQCSPCFRRAEMKCPKCQYIGFDTGDRCRNCGYEFAPAAGAASRRCAGRGRTARPDAPCVRAGGSGTSRPDRRCRCSGTTKRRSTCRSCGRRRRGHPSPYGRRRRHSASTCRAPSASTRRRRPSWNSGATRPRRGSRLRPRSHCCARRIPEPPASPEPHVPMLDDSPPVAGGAGRPLRGGGHRLRPPPRDRLRGAALHAAADRIDLRRLAGDSPGSPLVFLICCEAGVSDDLHAGRRPDDRQDGHRASRGAGRSRGRWPPGDAVQRALVEVASLVACGLPFLLALVDPARRGLHDRVARTRVVPAS